MSNSLLNISGKVDSASVALYKSVSDAANDLEIPFVVVGASARDIVLHYGHNAPIQRATIDVDFGIQVPNWSSFEALKNNLLNRGFKKTKAQHRLMSPSNIQLDIVPFGQIEDEQSNVGWPPDGAWVMKVLGFQEVCENAELVRIQDDPFVDIPVATPEGMAVLKLIAWLDRTLDVRRKDAKDLLYLMITYERIPKINAGLHDNQDLMEQYDWDIELTSAYQLGKDSQTIAADQTFDAIAKLFKGEHEKLSVALLVEEMCEHIELQFVRNEQLIQAFIRGFM